MELYTKLPRAQGKLDHIRDKIEYEMYCNEWLEKPNEEIEVERVFKSCADSKKR